jgi:hypothetical protein
VIGPDELIVADYSQIFDFAADRGLLMILMSCDLVVFNEIPFLIDQNWNRP